MAVNNEIIASHKSKRVKIADLLLTSFSQLIQNQPKVNNNKQEK